LIDAWAVLWLSALVIFNDARRDFKRVERVKLGPIPSASAREDTPIKENLVTQNTNGHTGLRKRHEQARTDSGEQEKLYQSDKRTGGSGYYWQKLPSNFKDRLDWVGDLVSSFRGPGWAHQISSIPSPPEEVMSSLPDQPPATLIRNGSGTYVYANEKDLVRYKLLRGLGYYMALDVLKVVMMRDRYFWGMIDAPPPSYLPGFFQASPVLVKAYRLVTSLLGVETALRAIFTLNPLFFVGILGPGVIGLRATSWHYPAFYGSFSAIYHTGLAGFWGSWWHQLFRFAFQAPSKWIIKQLGWHSQSGKAKVLATVSAFVLSGYLHFFGSLTMWPKTHPLEPFLFFLMQAVGVALQLVARSGIKRTGVKYPAFVGGTANLVSTFLWLYWLGPLFADDVARGGVWLFEPIPISPLRGLGFGLKGEGWWCWHGRLLYFYRGEAWYKSGIGF
jgi:hypothetical protein